MGRDGSSRATSYAASILHRDASFENPMYKTGFMRNHMVAVSATAQQLYIVSILVR
jgi:hypothetical protein